MRRRAPVWLGAGAVLVLAAAGVAVAGWNGSDDPGALTRMEYPAGERPPAPPIAGETLDGAVVDLADWHGDVIVVNVWASWCGPCRAELPELEEVYQETRDRGVRFVGVNIRDDRDRAVSFAASRVTFPSIFDPASEYALGFTDPPAPAAPPATLVVDRAGNLAAYFYRPAGRSELERIVTALAAES